MSDPGFDVDAFLARPLLARVATNGPTVRPTWYLWEDRAFWVLTGPWAALPRRLRADPMLAVVVDQCELASGLVRQVIARGPGELVAFDRDRARRKLERYLGADDTSWDERFRRLLDEAPQRTDTHWLRVRPESLRARDLSYRV